MTQNIIDRVFAFRFCPLHERLAKTDFFNLFRGNRVASDMFDALFRPDKISNLHVAIVTIGVELTNVNARRQIIILGGG